MKKTGLTWLGQLLATEWATRVVNEFERLEPLAAAEHEARWGRKAHDPDIHAGVLHQHQPKIVLARRA